MNTEMTEFLKSVAGGTTFNEKMRKEALSLLNKWYVEFLTNEYNYKIENSKDFRDEIKACKSKTKYIRLMYPCFAKEEKFFDDNWDNMEWLMEITKELVIKFEKGMENENHE